MATEVFPVAVGQRELQSPNVLITPAWSEPKGGITEAGAGATTVLAFKGVSPREKNRSIRSNGVEVEKNFGGAWSSR